MTFDFIPTEDGLRVHDQIENVWTDIDAGGRVEPEPAETDRFSVPLDDAVRFTTDRLVFGSALIIPVRTGDGELLATVDDSDRIDRRETLELDARID